MSTISYTGRLIVTSCWCGVGVAIPEDLYDYARRTGKSVWCPLGHTFVYGDGENKRLKAEVERLEARAASRLAALDRERAAHAHTERRLRSTKAVVTKTKKRIAAGACPCCHQRFPDLAEHMTTEHPGYGPETMPEGAERD